MREGVSIACPQGVIALCRAGFEQSHLSGVAEEISNPVIV